MKVVIDDVEYMPIPKWSGGITADQLHQIACLAAVSCAERHDYLPTDAREADRNWRAHAWVLDAMRLAIVASQINHKSLTPNARKGSET